MNPLSGITYGAQIAAAAQSHGLDPRLLAAVAAQETGGPGATSGSNIVGDGGHGHGLFQIDDRYHAFASTPQAMDPARNADYAAGMLSGLLSQYHGDVKAALSAYNSGSPTASGTMTTWGDGSRLGYADSVLRHEAILGGPSGELAAENPSTVAAVNSLSNFAGASGLTSAPALAGTSPTWMSVDAPTADTAATGTAATGTTATGAATAGAAATSGESLQVPAPEVPQWTPPQWQFHSFQNELQDGGGAVAAKDDAAMAGVIDPMSRNAGNDQDG
jgi:hypothetical protein